MKDEVRKVRHCTAAAHTLNPRTEGKDGKEGQKKTYDETRKERSMQGKKGEERMQRGV